MGAWPFLRDRGLFYNWSLRDFRANLDLRFCTFCALGLMVCSLLSPRQYGTGRRKKQRLAGMATGVVTSWWLRGEFFRKKWGLKKEYTPKMTCFSWEHDDTMGYPHINGDMDGQQQKSWLMQSNGHHPAWKSKRRPNPWKYAKICGWPEPENFTLSPNCLTSWWNPYLCSFFLQFFEFLHVPIYRL